MQSCVNCKWHHFNHFVYEDYCLNKQLLPESTQDRIKGISEVNIQKCEDVVDRCDNLGTFEAKRTCAADKGIAGLSFNLKGGW
jgi:hypothetical protein